MLEGNEIKPNKTSYCLERKDPEFERKMHDVLLVYKQIDMSFDMEEPKTITVSYDENPAFRLLRIWHRSFPPTQANGTIGRDYEYNALRHYPCLQA